MEDPINPPVQAGVLYVVATPIGNLADMTQRAIEVLGAVALVAAEDTRRSQVLLSHYGIATPLIALHEHNETALAPRLIERLLRGESIALVSDAGTPLVSDPGYRLLHLAIGQHIVVHPVPGASAVTAALSVAGLPTDRFVFEGFLPARKSARVARLESLRQESRTLVLFESSHRIIDSLHDLATVFGATRPAAVCRELSKRFETVLRGGLGELAERVAADHYQQKGEFVLVVGGASVDSETRLAAAVELALALQEHLPASKAAGVAARIHAVSRREVYRLVGHASDVPPT